MGLDFRVPIVQKKNPKKVPEKNAEVFMNYCGIVWNEK